MPKKRPQPLTIRQIQVLVGLELMGAYELANRLGISPQRVYQIKKQLERKLR